MAILDVGAKVKFDSAIFSATFPSSCDLKKCKSNCCEAGAIIFEEEKRAIMKLEKKLSPLLRPSRRDSSKWFYDSQPEDFERNGEAAPKDFHTYPSTGKGLGYCSFYNSKHGCSLQKLAMDDGRKSWAYKPSACVLYPLFEDEKRVVRPDLDLDESMWCCKKENHSTTMFQACKKEIEHAVGKTALKKLEKLEKKYYSPQPLAASS